MSKDSGQQSSYGVPYEILPTVKLSKSKNPLKKTVRRIEEQMQLRADIKTYNPGLFFSLLTAINLLTY